MMVSIKSLKLIMLPILALFMVMFSAYSADLYVPYKTQFSGGDVPSSVFVSGGACTTSSCTSVSSGVEVFNGNQAVTCWVNVNNGGSDAAFFSCMDAAKINGNVHPINAAEDFIVLKFDTTMTNGHLTYFSTEGDGFLVNYDRTSNYICGTDVCFDNNYRTLEFVRSLSAIAEIGKLNVVNVDDRNKPVQVTVPVEIEETVCSAFRLTNSAWWRAVVPSGYSDYSALTDVRLTISNDDTGVVYKMDSTEVTILADECVGLVAFDWTPSASLEDENIKFRVETEVIDGQVVSSLIDWAEVVENVYPLNLDDTCWARGYDYNLANIETFTMTTSISSISVGETLIANFKAGAFRDNDMTPMDFRAEIYFDDTLVSSKVHSTASLTLENFHENLTSVIAGLDAGEYIVKLIVTPINDGDCLKSESVTHSLNLNLLPIATYSVDFSVFDTASNPLDGAMVRIVLDGSDDIYYTIPLSYDETLYTDIAGEAGFNGVFRGNYSYDVSKVGYDTYSSTFIVGSDVNVFVTLERADDYLPVITTFDLTSSNGDIVPTNLELTWSVDNPTTSSIMCTLVVNTVDYAVPCDGTFDIDGYDIIGEGVFVLVVETFEGDIITDTITQMFRKTGPTILEFDLFSSNGSLVPTDLTFTWNAVHDLPNISVICDLVINGALVADDVSCVGSYDAIDYNISGLGVFDLIVTDDSGDIASRRIMKTFINDSQKLSELAVNLIVEKDLFIGDFDFSIEILDETVIDRFVDMKPIISCDGVPATLSGYASGIMPFGLNSRSSMSVPVYDFTLNTNDFNARILTDRTCSLVIELFDEYGTSTMVMKSVTFGYPTESFGIQSIRGNGIDVMNYMSTALRGQFSPGMNSFSFVIANNEAFSKKIEVSIISAGLGINFNSVNGVSSGAVKHVDIPLFIDPSFKAGMYPVRYSVLEGNEKYVRYSYIKVE